MRSELKTVNCKDLDSYRFHCEDKASISEEDNEDRGTEVACEHVDDVGLIIVFRAEGVVIRSTGALHSLRDVPVLRIKMQKDSLSEI